MNIFPKQRKKIVPRPSQPLQLVPTALISQTAANTAEIMERREKNWPPSIGKDFTSFPQQILRKLYIVGGGAKNSFLNELTKETTGKEVIAIPVEATAVGNIRVQIAADAAGKERGSAE